jgi:long-chain fatty acid transport protein
MRSLKTLIAAALLLPAVTLANGYDVPNVAPRDLSLAGSANAAQADAGATYAMPAGLARLPGLNLSLNASVLVLSTEWTAPAGSGLGPSPASMKFSPVPPVALFASYGFTLGGRRAGVGFGLNVPGGGNVFWDDQWAGRGRIISVDRKIYALYLTGGYELIPQVRLGGGLVYYYGVEYLKQGIQPFPDAYGELSAKGGAAAFDLSAEVTPVLSVPLTLAVDFKYKGIMKLKGDGHFQVPPALLTSVQDQGVTHELPYPSVLNVAAAWRLAPPVLVTAGFTYTFYEVYKADTFLGSKGMVIDVPRDYGNGSTYRVGVEYAASEQLALRAGVLRDQSGFRRDTYSPTLPDGNSWAGSLGAGYAITRNITVNAAFFYAKLDKVTASGLEAFPGSYQTNAWIASAGLSYQRDLAGGGK